LAFNLRCSQGCLVAPTLSIGSILLQQAAISASFHYNNVEIVESRASATVIQISLLLKFKLANKSHPISMNIDATVSDFILKKVHKGFFSMDILWKTNIDPSTLFKTS
jgi:hypothetical protein